MAASYDDEQELSKLNAKIFMCLFFHLIFLLLFSAPAVSFSIVKTLLGFFGSLPFKLETGYIGVDEKEDVQLFYYFVESEGNPREDPLVVWINGGPGCIGLSGLAVEIGPIKFNIVEYNGSLPTFVLNPYSWTKVASVIFVDSLVGTEFSYSRTFQGSQTGDTKFAISVYGFLRKWLRTHPIFAANPLYISSDSCCCDVAGIEAGDKPPLNFKGYSLGNPITDPKFDFNSRVPFVHRMAIIPDELYKSTKRSCKGEYIDIDSNNIQCANDLQAISNCTERLRWSHVTEPECPESFWRLLIKRRGDPKPSECRGTIKAWRRCHKDMPYKRDVKSAVSYHFYLNSRGYRALIYSGDHDMVAPYIGTQLWIKSLNLSIVDEWRPWWIDDQVGGFTRGYLNQLKFATVKARVLFNHKCFAK